MRLTGFTLALALAAVPIGAAAQDGSKQNAAPASDTTITLRGCVIAGQEKGTYVLTQVSEMPAAGRSAIPATAHGRRVVFWLDKDADLLKHANSAVQVTGVLNGIEESEIELKNGAKKDGGLLAEFEGPGKDVKVPNAVVAEAVGTSGRVTPEGSDIKTILMKLKVTDVKAVDYSCRAQ